MLKQANTRDRNSHNRPWQTPYEDHETLGQFNVDIIAGTCPVTKDNVPHNQAFLWTREKGVKRVHDKYYLPDEEGFWEASWYRRGDGGFSTAVLDGVTSGFLICTEFWFNHRAREYGRADMDILLCPRATPSSSSDTWVVGGRAAANLSGAYCLSSNVNGPNTAQMDFGGTGWIIEPEEAELLGTTSLTRPYLTVDIDLQAAKKAKNTYPRYVED